MSEAPLLRQVPGEFERLLQIFAEYQPRRILEIGVWEGGTLYEWVRHAPSGGMVVALDYFAEDVTVAAREAFHTWRSDLKLVSVAGDSTSPVTIGRVREHAPFHWIFIDGSHTIDDVRSDWQTYSAMTDGSAIVAFHDIAPHTRPGFDSEVPILWAEITSSGRYETEEIIAKPPQGWGGIGVVYL